GFPTSLRQSTATYAAFFEESRTRFTDVTKPDRKSRGKARDLQCALMLNKGHPCFAHEQTAWLRLASSLGGRLFDIKAHSRSLGFPGSPIRGFESEQRVRFSVEKSHAVRWS